MKFPFCQGLRFGARHALLTLPRRPPHLKIGISACAGGSIWPDTSILVMGWGAAGWDMIVNKALLVHSLHLFICKRRRLDQAVGLTLLFSYYCFCFSIF